MSRWNFIGSITETSNVGGKTLGNNLASGVVVILDGMDWPPYQPGSLVALQRLLAANNEFIADESREKFISTYA